MRGTSLIDCVIPGGANTRNAPTAAILQDASLWNMSFLLGNLLPPRGRTELVVLGTCLLRGRDPDDVEPEQTFTEVGSQGLLAVSREPDEDRHLVAPVVAIP